MGQAHGDGYCVSRDDKELQQCESRSEDIWYDCIEYEAQRVPCVVTVSRCQAEVIDEAPTVADVLRAGVPKESSDGVARLGVLVHARGMEPLCDPLTLLRFYISAHSNAEDAACMYQKTLQWRSGYCLGSVMATHGAGETYGTDGNRTHCNGEAAEWQWERAEVTYEAVLTQRHAFIGRLKTLHPNEGGPVLVWRVGIADVGALVREDLLDVMKRALAAHLEDCFQCSRAASLRKNKLVLSRLVIDAHGLGAVFMRHLKVINELVAFSTQFPEAVASVTVVRAPWLAARLWKAGKAFMPAGLASKFIILGNDFEAGLKLHSGLDVSQLPEFLGGQSSNSVMCNSEQVPLGTGVAFRQMQHSGAG